MASLRQVSEKYHLLRGGWSATARPILRFPLRYRKGGAKRRCTLLVVWGADRPELWIILTGHPPETVGVSWYGLRFWIEMGFKACPVLDTGAIKSLGWQWDKTRRTDPALISRHWLMLSVVTLLALAYGARVEDAQDRKIDPGRLRTPPRSPSPSRAATLAIGGYERSA